MSLVTWTKLLQVTYKMEGLSKDAWENKTECQIVASWEELWGPFRCCSLMETGLIQDQEYCCWTLQRQDVSAVTVVGQLIFCFSVIHMAQHFHASLVLLASPFYLYTLTDYLCMDQEEKEYDNSVLLSLLSSYQAVLEVLVPSLGLNSHKLGLLALVRTSVLRVFLEGSNRGVDW